jgi:hypothetical protein
MTCILVAHSASVHLSTTDDSISRWQCILPRRELIRRPWVWGRWGCVVAQGLWC